MRSSLVVSPTGPATSMADDPRLLLDPSAWARSGHPAARERWRGLIDANRFLCHPIFAVELLHNAINARDYQQLRNDLDQAFDWLWPDRETAEIALRLQQRLAHPPPPDNASRHLTS